MNIRTKEDWIELARVTVPLLPEYMSDQLGNRIDPILAENALNQNLIEENWEALHQKFQDIWEALPDKPSIHRYPFGNLCDLCSEYWVFYEED